ADVIQDIDALYAATSSPTDSVLHRSTGEAAATQRLILFALGDATFAVAARNVREVDRVPEITPVPGVPGWLHGVANLRGDLISVVDLRSFLGMEAAAPARRMLVASSDGGEVVSALLVDAVPGMALSTAADLSRPDAIADERLRPYVAGLLE